MFQIGDVQDQRLNPRLDLGREFADTFFAVCLVVGEKIRRTNRLAKVRQCFAAVKLLGGKRQADGHDLQSEFAAVAMFEFQRHARRASFDFLQLWIVMRDAFGKNGHSLTAFQHSIHRFKRVHDRAHSFGIILEAVHGNDAAAREQPLERCKTKQLHCRHEVHLARERRADDEWVGDGVGMIRRQQNRPCVRDALGMEAFDAVEIKSQRQPQQPAHQLVDFVVHERGFNAASTVR